MTSIWRFRFQVFRMESSEDWGHRYGFVPFRQPFLRHFDLLFQEDQRRTAISRHISSKAVAVAIPLVLFLVGFETSSASQCIHYPRVTKSVCLLGPLRCMTCTACSLSHLFLPLPSPSSPSASSSSSFITAIRQYLASSPSASLSSFSFIAVIRRFHYLPPSSLHLPFFFFLHYCHLLLPLPSPFPPPAPLLLPSLLSSATFSTFPLLPLPPPLLLPSLFSLGPELRELIN